MSLENVRLTLTVNSVSTSHIKKKNAREFARLDTHIKTPSVFQNVFLDSEITDSVDASNSVSSLAAVTHTSISKAHVSVLAMLDLTRTQPAEFVRLVAPTVSHACHQLSVHHVAQDLI